MQRWRGNVLVVAHGGLIGCWIVGKTGSTKFHLENLSCTLVEGPRAELLEYNAPEEKIREMLVWKDNS